MGAHRLSSGEARDLSIELPEGLAEAVRRGTTDRIERFGHYDGTTPCTPTTWSPG
ncbi:hypothetical protein ACWERW_32520 [Streptomyces sp. NPDC004012]